MLKSLQLIVSISVAVTITASTVEAAVSFPIDKNKQVLELANSDVNVPLCYMETGAGTVLDLSPFCKEGLDNNLGTTNSEINSVTPAVPNSNSSGSSSQRKVNSVRPFQTPYNSSNIKKFDDELYGEE